MSTRGNRADTKVLPDDQMNNRWTSQPTIFAQEMFWGSLSLHPAYSGWTVNVNEGRRVHRHVIQLSAPEATLASEHGIALRPNATWVMSCANRSKKMGCRNGTCSGLDQLIVTGQHQGWLTAVRLTNGVLTGQFDFGRYVRLMFINSFGYGLAN